MTAKKVYPVTFTRPYHDYTVIAIASHGNQSYGEFHYSYHLAQVDLVLLEAGYSDNKYRAAAWLHDTLEDTDMTPEDLATLFSLEVSLLVQACTGVGATRKARNEEIYRRLNAFPVAAPIKCADRIANLAFAIATKNFAKLEMYLNEWPSFKACLGPIMINSTDKRMLPMFSDLEDWVNRAEILQSKEKKKINDDSKQQL